MNMALTLMVLHDDTLLWVMPIGGCGVWILTICNSCYPSRKGLQSTHFTNLIHRFAHMLSGMTLVMMWWMIPSWMYSVNRETALSAALEKDLAVHDKECKLSKSETAIIEYQLYHPSTMSSSHAACFLNYEFTKFNKVRSSLHSQNAEWLLYTNLRQITRSLSHWQSPGTTILRLACNICACEKGIIFHSHSA